MTRAEGRVWERWYAFLDTPSPLLKQAPTATALVLAIVITLVTPDLVFDPLPAALVGIGAVAAATSMALVLSLQRTPVPEWTVLTIPMIDILGLGLFRAGTGGTGSIYAALILMPIVWLAAAPGLRNVIIVVGLSSLALSLPYLADPPESGSQWLRVIVSPAIFAVVAVIINELSRLGRVRAEEAERLVAERSDALEETMRAVAKLQDSEQRYRELLEMFRSVWNATTAQAVVATDHDGLVVAWNPGATELFGFEDLDAEYAMRVQELFSPDTVAMLDTEALRVRDDDPLSPGVRSLFALADTGIPVVREFPMTREDGSTVPVRLTITIRRDGTDARVGYLLVATDETRAHEVSRMKDEFVGMISHELRTPLSSILGYLELLRDDTEHPLTEEQLQFLSVAERNARRLLRLVGDLLFTAQVESGRFPLDKHEVDLAAVVRAAIESAQPVADTGGVGMVSAVPEREVRVLADPVRIGQAVDNLISNALKFTPRGGDVVVTLTADEQAATISVRDTGLGIPPDEVDRLFTRFFRASTATRNAVPGVGLGLNITKAIVSAHDGEMDVASEEGVGTEFRIVLPRGTH
ncbi:ATP-binding protein [Protaetiibacter mangrovi]|uniref:histidine kinase n=3 Tax=Microbacteriaceae TaxID=85023 RepID=A0ABT1ZH24_9MICO|nr:ATP-binding protein [Protaetiibacter mangrovi]MCS0499992.1 ATP-binding protein [Protaetiibacter mangrovi]TPX02081.1 PAS domain S-box protein [Schumannella luteola]